MRLRLILPAFAVVLFLGLIHLPFPLAWDQAVFAMGAEVVARGGALYRDFWDSNQPGVFLFYAAAGRMFGFTEVGFHALELIVMLVLAIVVVVRLRHSFDHAISLALAPILTVGYQYAITSDWHLTQKEFWVGAPLFLTLLWALRGGEGGAGRPRDFVLSGVAGGVVIATKLLFLPIVGAFWLLGWFRLTRAIPTARFAGVGRMMAATALGAGIPLAAIALMLAAQGSLHEAMWTTFVFPWQAMSRVTDWNSAYFVDSLRWIATRWAGLYVFAIPGMRQALRRDRWLATGLLLWLAAGVVGLELQRLSGWQYQFLLILPPLGILAAFGVDWLMNELRTRISANAAAAVAVVTLMLLSAPAIAEVARKVIHLSRHEWALTPQGRWAFQVETSRGNAYGRWRECSTFLSRSDARPGPIYVIGDPVLYWVAGRRPAVPRCGGTMMNQLSLAEWEGLTRGIERTTPYIFLSRGHERLLEYLRPNSDPMIELIADRYRPFRNGECGTWYVVK